MDISGHRKAIAGIYRTSVFWGLVFGIVISTVTLMITRELFPAPYPQITMLLVFSFTTLYFYRMWFKTLLNRYTERYIENIQGGNTGQEGKVK